MSSVEEKITEAELEVMEVLWDAGEPLTLGQIKEALWEKNGDTTKTLLRRLCAKGAVGQDCCGGCAPRGRWARRSGRCTGTPLW